MSSPYIGEIKMFGGTFAPAGWAMCDGTLIPISENDTLFNLIGTTYGGDGQSTFALPDLRGRIPIHAGQGPGLASNHVIGEMAGVEAVPLTTNQIPVHNHALVATTNPASLQEATNAIYATSPQVAMYTETVDALNKPLSASEGPGVAGGSQPHENMMPYLAVTFIISLFGIFPTQN